MARGFFLRGLAQRQRLGLVWVSPIRLKSQPSACVWNTNTNTRDSEAAAVPGVPFRAAVPVPAAPDAEPLLAPLDDPLE